MTVCSRPKDGFRYRLGVKPPLKIKSNYVVMFLYVCLCYVTFFQPGGNSKQKLILCWGRTRTDERTIRHIVHLFSYWIRYYYSKQPHFTVGL